ncbi:unnamed protein product [Peronospora destructor]|uniref:Uncharacterized protein n=1 Tax=Peronospora destructor TaxID=86335 RepID=A0AAV0TV49_9STRA|nr:unnamed protein product [Peronospora destructor]
MQPVQHSAICQVGHTREHRSAMTAAKSTTNMPLSASSLVTHPKGAKRRDSAELNHEDDEHCRQQHDHGHEGGNQRGVNDFSDDGCKVMANFDGFEPIGKPFAMPRFTPSLSPTCVSALARNEVVKSNADYDKPSWTIQEFKEYLGMLELLQDVSSDAEGGEMCLSADCLGQMERLLTSLLPQGV